MNDDCDLDLTDFPVLRRLAAHDRVHVHGMAGDESDCEPCVIDKELRGLCMKHAYDIAVKLMDEYGMPQAALAVRHEARAAAGSDVWCDRTDPSG